MIQAILWDHDGVLVNTEPWFYEATRRTLTEVGVDLPRDRWVGARATGQRLEQIVPKKVVDSLDFQLIRRLRDDLYEEFLSAERMTVDGAEDILRVLASRFRMALVTDSDRRFIDQLHGRSALLGHFEVVITSEDCERGKPNPDPYLAALARLGVPASAAVCIEDSAQGLKSATAAGARCIIVRNAFMMPDDLQDAWTVLDSLAELPGFLAV